MTMKKLVYLSIALLMVCIASQISAQVIPIGSSVQAVRDTLNARKYGFTEVTDGTMNPRVTGINVPIAQYLNTNWSISYEFRKPDTLTHALYTAYKVKTEDYEFLLRQVTQIRGEPTGDHPTSAIGKYWVVDNRFITALSMKEDRIYLEQRDIDYANSTK